MKKTETKKLFGAAKVAHEKKVCAERKKKASIASMKSRAKANAKKTPEELAAWKKIQCEASKKSYKVRLAKMTPEELAKFKADRNAKAKARRELKKALEAAMKTATTVVAEA